MNCKFIHKNMFRHRCLYRGKKILKKQELTKGWRTGAHPKEMGFVDIIILSICEQKPLAEGRPLHVWAYIIHTLLSVESLHTPTHNAIFYILEWEEHVLSFIWASTVHCLNQAHPGIVFKHHWRRSCVGWTLVGRFPLNYRTADGKSAKF